ncbi:MAG: SpoIIE family protein phosphatase [Candidatus Pacebacteria bacterium]|nr:SpoIIE family protein phosphatase [Candidatus Paceibacterota bacterium]
MEDFKPQNPATRTPETKVIQPAKILDGKEATDLVESAESFVFANGDEVVAGTDLGIGGGKNKNEDRLLVVPGENFVAVIDGIGGEPDGDLAAQVLAEEFQKTPLDIKGAVGRAKLSMKEKGFFERTGACFITARILENNKKKNLEVWQQGNCSVVIFSEKGIIKFKSEDDVFVNTLVKGGQITPDQALYNPRRNVVTSAVTIENTAEPKTYDLSSIDLEPGDKIFIMSDGISDNLLPEEIWQAVEEMKTKEDAISAVSFITSDRSYNRKKIIEETGGIQGRKEKGVYADGFKPEPKPDNRALAIIEIK